MWYGVAGYPAPAGYPVAAVMPGMSPSMMAAMYGAVRGVAVVYTGSKRAGLMLGCDARVEDVG